MTPEDYKVLISVKDGLDVKELPYKALKSLEDQGMIKEIIVSGRIRPYKFELTELGKNETNE